MSSTLTAAEVAEMTGVSEWGIYQSVRNGTCPFPFVKVGRRILFIRGALMRLLEIPQIEVAGLEPPAISRTESAQNGPPSS